MVKNMLSKELIENRIENFWGYGNLKSDVWFIGMEEGFGGTLDDLKARFEKTQNRSVIDIKNDMTDVDDHMKWFSSKPNIQRTWSKLILILLAINYKKYNPDNEEIRSFQKNLFGRLEGNHCLLEFMPLPSKSTKPQDWIYNQFNVNYLITRKTYIASITPRRILLLQKLIKINKPKILIFYSLTYLEKWKSITNKNFIFSDGIYFNDSEETKYFIIPHPTAHGMTKIQWNNISKKISETYYNL
jgi:hypothetical protein